MVQHNNVGAKSYKTQIILGVKVLQYKFRKLAVRNTGN
jgi:hypothetical protein